jgi:hypothetical protein
LPEVILWVEFDPVASKVRGRNSNHDTATLGRYVYSTQTNEKSWLMNGEIFALLFKILSRSIS